MATAYTALAKRRSGKNRCS